MAKPPTILLVEFDALVRRSAVGMLTWLGYTVREAGTGRRALEILTTSSDVELLITHVRLPFGVNGPDLAQEARRIRPDVMVLFTSTPAEPLVLGPGAVIEPAQLLIKPYKIEELDWKIRKVLESPESRKKTARLSSSPENA